MSVQITINTVPAMILNHIAILLPETPVLFSKINWSRNLLIKKVDKSFKITDCCL